MPYIGQIMYFSHPRTLDPDATGFLPCDGRSLSISNYEVLYAVIGTTYGGNGVTTFNLPDLRGRTLMGATSSPGVMGGEEVHLLTSSEMPLHTHMVTSSTSSGLDAAPASDVLASGGTVPTFGPSTATTPMSPAAIGSAGSAVPHDNMQPYFVLMPYICFSGIYPVAS